MSISQATPTNNDGIKSYPVISAAAIKAGFPAAARLYDILQDRAARNDGLEFFSRADLTSTLEESAVDRAIHEGAGLFWTWTGRNWHMTARSKVAARLGVENPGHAVGLPSKAFAGRLSFYKAHVYAAFLEHLRDPIRSRDNLCETFGVSLPTLLDWERQTGVRTTPCFVLVEPFGGTQDQKYGQYMELDRCRTGRVWISIVTPRGRITAGRRMMDNRNEYLPDAPFRPELPGWDGDPHLTFQTSNVYHSPLRTISGRSRRLRTEIKRIGSPAHRPGGKPVRSRDDEPRNVRVCTPTVWLTVAGRPLPPI